MVKLSGRTELLLVLSVTLLFFSVVVMMLLQGVM